MKKNELRSFKPFLRISFIVSVHLHLIMATRRGHVSIKKKVNETGNI